MKSIIIFVSLIVSIVFVIGTAFVYLDGSTGHVTQIVQKPVLDAKYFSPMPEQEMRTLPSAAYECYDSDGQNFMIKGTVTIGKNQWVDECDYYGKVVENICLYGVKNQPQRGIILHECKDGCYNGACR